MNVLRFASAYLRTKYHKGFSTRKALERYQEKKVLQFLKKLPKHLYYFKYYQEQGVSISLEHWRSYPVIDKTFLMNHFDRLNLPGISREEAFTLALKAEETRNFSPTLHGVTVGLSSGTSGNRGLFLVSPQERDMWAGVMLGKTLPEPIWNQQRIAFFLRANSNLYESTRRSRISFNFYDLLEDTEKLMKQLEEQQPTIVVAPPSMLRVIAHHQRTKNVQLQPVRIISVAEVLDPLDRTYIEETFDQIVHQVYQCTEGFLGATCEHGTLHLNEDMLVVERDYLDEEKTKFSPIITDFTRTTQPIIRYRLNDILAIRKSPCPCGSVHTAIEQIEGRCDDMFYFSKTDGSGWREVFPDFIRRTIISASGEIEEYRVIQHELNRLEIMLRTKHNVSVNETVERQFGLFFASIGCELPELVFTHYQAPSKGTKLKRIERRTRRSL